MKKSMLCSMVIVLVLAIAGCSGEKNEKPQSNAENNASKVEKEIQQSVSVPTKVVEEDKVYESAEISGVCNQINDVSTMIAALAGKDFGVAASSVRFLGSRLGSDGSCRFEIDTAIGPKTCPVLYLIRKGGKNIVAVPSTAQTLMCGY